MAGGHRVGQHPRFELGGLWGMPGGGGFGEGIFWLVGFGVCYMTVISGSQRLSSGGLRLLNVSWNLLVLWTKASNGLIPFGSARSVMRFLAFHSSLSFSRLRCLAWAGQKIR